MVATKVSRLNRAEQRTAFAHDVLLTVEHASRGTWKLNVSRTERRTIVMRFQGPKLRVLLDLDGDELLQPPMLHWHDADGDLAPCEAAWQSVNRFHSRKATSYPRSLQEALDMLQAGIEAERDGSAFLEAAEGS